MTPEERADDILRRCWWREEKHPGEVRPPFTGLDTEIAAALRAAVEEEREACAREAVSQCEAWTEEADGESLLASGALYGMAEAARAIAARIRARGKETGG